MIDLKYWRIMGNGDHAKGLELEGLIAERIAHARKKHPVFAGSKEEALAVIGLEFDEFKKAVQSEGRVRQIDEALDVIATCIRFINAEFPGVLCAPE